MNVKLEKEGENLDGTTLTLLVTIIGLQLLTLLKHERRITRLEEKINLLCKKLSGEK